MRTLIADSMRHIDEEAWDKLVGNHNLFNRYRWLLSLERANGPTPILLGMEEGELTGGVATWRGTGQEPGALVTPLEFLEMLPGHQAQELLWLSPRRPVFNDLVCTDGFFRGATMSALIEQARSFAEDNGLAAVVMPYVPLSTAIELSAVHRDARAIVHSADAVIKVPPNGEQGLFEGAHRKKRTKWRRELRVFQEEGNSVRWVSLTDDIIAALVPLILQTRSKYGSQSNTKSLLAFFEAQRSTGLLDEAVACVCENGGQIVAGIIFYPYQDELCALFVGFDYARTGRGFEYFVLLFYAAVAWAASHDIARYRLNFSSYQAKVARGASLSPLAAVVLPVTTPPIDHATVRSHNRAMVDSFTTDFGHYAQALTDDWLLVE